MAKYRVFKLQKEGLVEESQMYTKEGAEARIKVLNKQNKKNKAKFAKAAGS